MSPPWPGINRIPESNAKNFNDLKSSEANKINNQDMKTEIKTVNPTVNNKPDSASLSNQSSSKIKFFNVKKPTDDHLKSPASGHHSSMMQISRTPLKRGSKLQTTQIASSSNAPLSSGRAQTSSNNDSSTVAQKGGKTIVYIESNHNSKLKPQATDKDLSRQGSNFKESASVSMSRLSSIKTGKHVTKVTDINVRNNNLKTFQSKSKDDRKSSKDAVIINSPHGSSENILAPSNQNTSKLGVKPGLVGPRRSSGLRMWPGSSANNSRQVSQTSAHVSSSALSPSRSPSPSTPAVERKTSEHTTLPRSSQLSRMRTPAAPSGHSAHASQRRSYGGLASQSGLGVPRPLAGKHRSAPNTPRHSQVDLSRPGTPGSVDNSPAGSRSNSPVILRQKPSTIDNHSRQTPSTGGLGSAAQGTSMLKRPSAPSLNTSEADKRVSGSAISRPSSYNARPSSAVTRTGPRTNLSQSISSPSTNHNQSLPTPKSRLPNPPKSSFGFSY